MKLDIDDDIGFDIYAIHSVVMRVDNIRILNTFKGSKPILYNTDRIRSIEALRREVSSFLRFFLPRGSYDRLLFDFEINRLKNRKSVIKNDVLYIPNVKEILRIEEVCELLNSP